MKNHHTKETADINIYIIYSVNITRINLISLETTSFPGKSTKAHPSSIGAISKGTPQLVAEALAIGIQNQAANTTQRLGDLRHITLPETYMSRKKGGRSENYQLQVGVSIIPRIYVFMGVITNPSSPFLRPSILYTGVRTP